MEEWRVIEEFPQYKISNLGRVINTKKNTLMTITIRPNGYSVVKLSMNNIARERKVHRLVAIAFIPNPNNYDCINHKNEDKTDNRVENLEWCNHQHNNIYGTRIKRQSDKIKIKVKQCDMQGNIIKEFNSINEAAEELKILACNISNCLHRKQKSTPRNLYTWKF
jgi:hypothetical protein